MPIAIGMQQEVQVRGPDGTILWVGTAVVGIMYHVVNTDTAAIQFGEAVRFDSTNGVIPRLEITAAGVAPAADLPMSLNMAGLRVASTADINWLGVALDGIGVGKTGLVAGDGSICTVQCTTSTIVIGAFIGGSATAGRAAAIAATTSAVILGNCFKTNTVAAPGTGTTGHVGLMVNPQ